MAFLFRQITSFFRGNLRLKNQESGYDLEVMYRNETHFGQNKMFLTPNDRLNA
jgi:hypothetical protein